MPGRPTIRSCLDDGIVHAHAWCACGHEAKIPLADWPVDAEFITIKARLRCRCGQRPCMVQPCWEERTSVRGIGR